jgi:O-antigen ligase
VTLATVTVPPTAAVTPEPPVPTPAVGARDRLRVDLPSATVLAACAWWAIGAPRLWGGRGPGAVTVGAVLTALALVALRPQRYLPRRVLVLALAVSTAAFGVAALAPTGWAGASTAAGYVCASWMVVVVAAGVVRRPDLRDGVILLLVAGVMIEVAEAWLPWWGGETAAAPITGTFYWYDPFAAFLVAGTVLGWSLWLWRARAVAALGLVGAALGSIGLVYSTSRAADVCWAIATLAVTGTYLWRTGRHGVSRTLAGLLTAAGAVWAIGGPPFFAHRVTPFSGTAARAAGQSLSQNGRYRLDFWHEALGVFQRHPVAGGGYHSLASASIGHVPHGWPLSPLAHNGYLQALSDGGLLLAAPLALAIGGIVWCLLRCLHTAFRDRDFSVAGFAAPLLLAALLAHSAVDFDWSYAADLLVAAVLAGFVVASRTQRRPADRTTGRVVTAMVLTGVALLGLAAGTAWSGDLRQSLPLSSASTAGGVR